MVKMKLGTLVPWRKNQQPPQGTKLENHFQPLHPLRIYRFEKPPSSNPYHFVEESKNKEKKGKKDLLGFT